LRAGHDRHARLDDSGLLARDQFQRIAEHFAVIERNGRDRAGRRAGDHVGGIRAPTQPDLQHAQLRRIFREQHEGHRRQHLEHRDRVSGIDLFHPVQRGDQRGVAHQFARNPEPLVQAHQMRRCRNVNPHPRRLADRADEGAGAALSIGAGDMDHRRQSPLGMAEVRQKPFQPAEAEIDESRIEGV
jgi:hypothetical protein